jgi:hypothetical protein
MAKKKQDQSSDSGKEYNFDDALHISEDLMKLFKEKKYNPGAFVHGLMFTLEFAQHTYQIPQQQLAGVKRNCRKYVQALMQAVPQPKEPSK